MKLDVLDIKGNKVAEALTLNDEIFGIAPNEDVLRQYIRVYLANQRQGNSSTKNKGEVSGGGRKPWKQKGTGRARQGSIRSPQWVHGGVAHGPKPKDWSLSLPNKVKDLAFKSAVSDKIINNKVIILDSLSLEAPKTSEMNAILSRLNVSDKCVLVTDAMDSIVLKSAANLKRVRIIWANDINAYDIINAKDVVFIKKAVLDLQEKYENR